ncbi:sigma-54 dependent transcriptional regulator [Alkalihalobacillus oceani]|uniref:sigma-54-dependent transcriptional regulator n=1 Tax=Halalkalibacter oceani TaxID=1653776 RepID=UPI00203E914C|nr:sigma-54 dependent transcriptional regulator [Halalkalibacter oceani]MCM3761440.1 sigma-54 dependent transcriptional regulator [Halalkalibacter oceani]
MNKSLSVLIVDDEEQLCKLIAQKLKKSDMITNLAHDGETALLFLKNHSVDIVILDYMLPDMTGTDVLKEIKHLSIDVPVIMLTAYGNVESAVAAMKLGAVDYLVKPMELNELKKIIEKVCIDKQNKTIKLQEPFVYHSKKMKQVIELLTYVKETNASILIQGESGVGKTTLAKWIHEQSKRKNKPFLSISCAAIPEELLESELFGYQKEAFNGSHSSKVGKFVASNGGTILLDEISEISPNMQAKLLHVIEDKLVMQLGSKEFQQIDVRIITTTNKDIKEFVRAGRFREDLYYRLNVIEVEVPPLRERREEIPLLIKKQLSKLNEKYSKNIKMDQRCINILTNYHWPGNIRELMNTLERIHILKRFGLVVPEDLVKASFHVINQQPFDKTTPEHMFSGKLPEVLEEVEEQMIKKALQETNGNQTRAAEKLGIARHTLIYKVKKFGLKS